MLLALRAPLRKMKKKRDNSDNIFGENANYIMNETVC